MAGIRIRWRSLAKAVGAVALLLLALQVLPGLLRPPDPPPLGADVGLPRVKVEAAPRDQARRRGAKRSHSGQKAPRRRSGEAVIGTKPQRRHRRTHATKAKRRAGRASSYRFEPEPADASTPAPGSAASARPTPQAPAPAPAPAPSTTPPPAAPAPPPNDGSEEFAPR